MKLRYTIEEIGKNGVQNTFSQDFEKSEIKIGRGANVDIILDSQFVSLEHAKISLIQDSLHIYDLASLGGTLVNGKVIASSSLKSGDVVQIGDINLSVANVDGAWIVTEHREHKETQDLEKVVKLQELSLKLDTHLPSFKVLSIIISAIIIAFFFAVPLVTKRAASWSSGPISNKHQLIAAKCDSCHGEPFTLVQDDKCKQCHDMTLHATAFKGADEIHSNLNIRCASCHMEHNGDKLVLTSSKLCLDCHRSIKTKYTEAVRQDVSKFDAHPEFSVLVQPLIPGGDYKRVRLSDVDQLRDNSNIKLNHEKHLVPVRGPKGDKVTLGCRDCHEPSEDLKSIKPISFERHCQSCHTLEFDERLKGRQVPHAESVIIYRTLYSEYAKLLLSNEEVDKSAQEVLNIRARPGTQMPSAVAASGAPADQFKREFVEKSAREAERQLFTKTACFLCHRVSQKEITQQEAFVKQISMFDILKPDIPLRWMPDAAFSHRAHEEVQCEECHEGVKNSSKTTQILLPKVEKCLGCHAEQAGSGKVKSDCIMCHSYHDQIVMRDENKKSIQAILATINK